MNVSNICDNIPVWIGGTGSSFSLSSQSLVGRQGSVFFLIALERHMNRSSRWIYVRKMAWDRDRKAKAPCHICGMPIDYLIAPSSAPDAWEPDHLVPVSKRPDLELDLNNVLPSHMRCNRVRGDGTNGENDLGQISRIW